MILFGISLILIGEKVKFVVSLFEMFSFVIFCVVDILMKVVLIGVFGVFVFIIGKYGIVLIVNLVVLVGMFYLILVFFVIVILGMVCMFNGFLIFWLILYFKVELLLVLGIFFLEFVLFLLMEKMEKVGCKCLVVGLVVFIGYLFNFDGINIYMMLVVLFIV